MDKMTSSQRKEAKNVIPFQNEFNMVSPTDLENILEWLHDKGHLTGAGADFKHAFWNLFIKK
jgi:hypothetical protein